METGNNVETPNEKLTAKDKWKKWFKRLGFAGFMFFLLKGLAWLAVMYWGFSFAGC